MEYIEVTLFFYPSRGKGVGRRMSGRAQWVAIAALAVVAIASSAVAVTQFNRADSAERSRQGVEDRLDRAQKRISELEEEAEQEESNPLEDLLGEGSGDFGDLFGGGDLSELLGGDSAGLLECLTGGGAGSGGSDALDGLLGDIAGGGSEDAQKALEGLFGGLSGGSSSGPARSQIPKISTAVEDVRKLKFSEKVDVEFMSPERLAKRAARLFLEDYTVRAARSEQRMLIALGAIPADTDLRATMKDLLESQVAGFYVPKDKNLFVPGQPNQPLTAVEKTVIAHELEHALADQRLNLPIPEVTDTSKMDENVAALSLVEGDATLTMQRYSLTAIPLFEQLTILSDPAYAASQQALEGIPTYLVEQLQFPYIDGLNFTCELHKQGGWAAVDKAYDDPPSTSAQVLFPARYRRGEASVSVRPPRAPGAGWNESFGSSFGAANLLWLFKAPGGDEGAALSDPVDRVGAWGGGRVTMWSRGQDIATAVTLVQRKGAAGLCDSVAEWYDAAFDDDADAGARAGEEIAVDGSQDAVLRCSGNEVRLGIGPDLATARAVIR
jgi:hypothetical protein